MLTLAHIQLRSADPEFAAQWYVCNLEASIIDRDETAFGEPFVVIEMGGTRIHIIGNPPAMELPVVVPDSPVGLEHFGLQTENLKALVARLQTWGVEVLEPIHEGLDGTLCYIKGPDNVRIELQQFD